MVADIEMPEESGYDLLRQLRSLPAELGGQTPAVALTAYATAHDRVKVLRAGFQMHISKPVQPAELAAVVASLARKTGSAIQSSRPRLAASLDRDEVRVQRPQVRREHLLRRPPASRQYAQKSEIECSSMTSFHSSSRRVAAGRLSDQRRLTISP